MFINGQNIRRYCHLDSRDIIRTSYLMSENIAKNRPRKKIDTDSFNPLRIKGGGVPIDDSIR